MIGDQICNARHDSSDRVYLRDRGECWLTLSNGGGSDMSIRVNVAGLFCRINRGLGNRGVIGSSQSFTPLECMTTLKRPSLSLSRVCSASVRFGGYEHFTDEEDTGWLDGKVFA